MLGLSQTYVDAQRIVLALERAQVDDSYYGAAADIINSYVEPERTEVIEKAIALGADPDFVRALAVGGETIEVVDKISAMSPIVVGGRRVPWWIVGLGGLGAVAAVAGVIAYRRRRLVA